MRNVIMAAAMLVVGMLAMGQATKPAATQPAKVPDLMELVAKMPANLRPAKGETGRTRAERIAWMQENLIGKTVSANLSILIAGTDGVKAQIKSGVLLDATLGKGNQIKAYANESAVIEGVVTHATIEGNQTSFSLKDAVFTKVPSKKK